MSTLRIKSSTKPFTMVKNEIIDSENILNEHEKLLYIILLRYGNEAFPSMATLSKKSGASKRTVQRTIDSLIEKGLLIKENRQTESKGNISNLYTLIDKTAVWSARSAEEAKQAAAETDVERAIRLLENKGYVVEMKKEPKSITPTKAKIDKDSTSSTDYFKAEKAKSQYKPKKNRFDIEQKQEYNIAEIEKQLLNN